VPKPLFCRVYPFYFTGGLHTRHGIPPRVTASSKEISMQFAVHLFAHLQEGLWYLPELVL
jgi:Fe-S-cluster containining protein